MTLPPMPPLPEPFARVEAPYCGMARDGVDIVPAFSAKQLRTYAEQYGRLCAEAEREAIIALIPGGCSVDPQWVCDAIRARGQR